jgi:NAD(P)H dehydrogenase (quinone)
MHTLPFSFADVGFPCLQTLPQEVLTKMYAPAKPDYPIVTAADLPQYDGFLVGYVQRWSVQRPTPD